MAIEYVIKSISHSLRVHSLMKSTPDLPASFVLIGKTPNASFMVGHVRICRTMDDETGAWLESGEYFDKSIGMHRISGWPDLSGVSGHFSGSGYPGRI